ncbi:MAG: hypothetical protein RBU37_18980 [Myxococcota bacterium]|jgi:hypothetical protein|nr:hypothetical protein [Myxococcota bacterium]
MQQWWLFIDEAGAFDDKRDRVAVGGLLIDADWSAGSAVALRNALQSCVPYIPWPLHLRELESSVMHFIWTLEFERDSLEREQAREELCAFERVLNLDDRERLSRVRQAVRHGQVVKLPDLQALQRQSGRLPTLDLWVRRQQRSRSAIDTVIGSLLSLPNADQRLVWLGASEAVLQDCWPPPGHDRYLNLLSALVERACDALVARSGSHRVELRVLSRDVWDAHTGASRRLSTADLDGLLQRCATQHQYHAQDARIRFEVAQPSHFDADCDAYHVLADFFSSRARFRFQPYVSHEQLTQRLRQHCLASASTPLEVNGSGHAQRFVNQARTSGAVPTTTLPGAVSLWARQDAQRWAALVATHQSPAQP